MPCCIYRQHYDILYHGRWHLRGKQATGTSGPVRTALWKADEKIRIETAENQVHKTYTANQTIEEYSQYETITT